MLSVPTVCNVYCMMIANVCGSKIVPPSLPGLLFSFELRPSATSLKVVIQLGKIGGNLCFF